MGIFVQYMFQFVTAYNTANGIPTRSKISEWFRNKKAIRRSGLPGNFNPDKKSAVVVVGVSCIGKSTYVQKFLSQYPDFEVISYDEASYQKADEIQMGAKAAESRMAEIVEADILQKNGKNIIVDSMCINPAGRAALTRFLDNLGYEIHLIFFTQAYTEASIKKHITNRAIELTLYQEYLAKNNKNKKLMRELMPIRNNILEISATEKGISVDELKAQTEALPATLSNIMYLTRFYNNEVETHRVWWQQKRELFMLGADYYYEL